MGIVEEELGMFFSVQMVLFSFNLLARIYGRGLVVPEKHEDSCSQNVAQRLKTDLDPAL
jgi:hypothetical protein